MEDTFYVFWIPTLYHITDRQFEVCSVAANISDDPNEIHEVVVSIEDNWNITIANKVGTLLLTHMKKSSNGLISYKSSIDMSDSCSQVIFKEIPNAIYHLIKSLFHKHEHHDDKVDSLLRAYVSKSQDDVAIDRVNNEPLMHYLRIYEKKFIAYAQQLSMLSQAIKNNEKDLKRKYKLLDNYTLIEKKCQEALGESVYCNTLLYSKFFDCDCKEQNNNDSQRRLSLNIKNAVDNIRVIREKNLYGFN